jgi:pimeloyl-ACP methyl ester carboxylesterase
MKRDGIRPSIRILLILAFVFPLAARAQNKSSAPLSIAKEGYVFAGGKYSTVKDKKVMSGQLYAEFQIPSQMTHPYPIVMVHGGGQSGANFTGTPDGREGWAQFFLRDGYAVYVVDQPGRGRAAYQPDLYGALPAGGNPETIQQRFTSVERYKLWPQAHLHTQWPGGGEPGDPIFDQFVASQLPGIPDFTLQQVLNRDALVALLDKIGPAILLTHSQSGAYGWPVADARPDLVKAIVAVEPSGPPFIDIQTVGPPDWFRDAPGKARPWGVTAVPLRYAPAAADASDLLIEQQEKSDAPDLAKCWLQRPPARQLPNLQKVPILIVTSEASYHTAYDHCTVKYLEQAGVHATWTKLADVGIKGNGHMMMLEKNNQEVATVISRWLGKSVSGGPKKGL